MSICAYVRFMQTPIYLTFFNNSRSCPTQRSGFDLRLVSWYRLQIRLSCTQRGREIFTDRWVTQNPHSPHTPNTHRFIISPSICTQACLEHFPCNNTSTYRISKNDHPTTSLATSPYHTRSSHAPQAPASCSPHFHTNNNSNTP